MKLLVIGIDAVSPKILLGNLNTLPNISKLVKQGAAGSYIGYTYGYGSRDNWISMYTGLTPEQHGTINHIYRDTGKPPRLYDYSNQQPFWKVLNSKGFKVGLWKGLNTTPPEIIDGYMVGGEYAHEKGEEDPETWSHEIQFHKNLSNYQEQIVGSPPKVAMPKTPEDFGYSWEELERNPELYLEFMTPDYFIESIDYLEKMLMYHLNNIKIINRKDPVDLFWFYDPIFDFLSHFQMHDSNKKVVIQALKVIDEFVGELITILNPENTIFISDHGQLSFGDHFPNMSIEQRKESFGLANQSHFIDEYIFLPARNGAVLTAAHAPEATFIGAGPMFEKGRKLNNEYRTVDIYPLILEMFDCVVPEGRSGYVPNILTKENYTNEIYPENIQEEDVLIVANKPVYELNAFINQYFLRHRFHRIHVVTEEKYLPAYEVNPHVYDCFRVEDFLNIQSNYYKIIIPTENTKYSLNYEYYMRK